MAVSPAAEPEDRLQEAVLFYLQAADSGQPLDPQTLVERFADLSTELQAYFDEQACLASLLKPLRNRNAPELASLSESRTFGRYELLAELGRGGMGIVYKARQLGIARLVALKIVRAGNLATAADLERFRNETKTVAGLEHPHIVPIYDIGEHEGQLYFTMPLMEGGSLASRLASYRDSLRDAAQLVATISQAVHHAHQRGVLHRDIKPLNILLDASRRPFVCDFGLAKRLDSQHGLTETGALLGTPGYMSPEQALCRTREITNLSDVYGLGAILYALVTGRPPFQRASLLETLDDVRQREPESPQVHNPQVDRDLAAICMKCLEKSPSRRYVSAEALAEDLDRWLAGLPVQARSISHATRLWRWCGRNRLLATLSAATVLLLLSGVVGLAIGLLTVSRARQEVEEQRTKAVEAAATLREQLYAAQMPIAYQHWERGEVEKLSDLLTTYLPRGEEPDLRGFEWHYLQALVESQPRPRQTYQHGRIVYHAAFSPDGRWVATSGEDRTVRLWQAQDGTPLAVLDSLQEDANGAAFFPNGNRLISASEDGTLREWDLHTFASRLLPFRSSGAIRYLQIVDDGRQLVVAGQDPRIRLLNTSDWSVARELKAHPVLTSVAVISPNGRWLASSGHDGQPAGLLQVWDLEKTAIQCTISNATWMHTAVFSPDSTLLATGDEAGWVKLWDAATGRLVQELGQHLIHARGVAFSPDGGLLASGGHDGRIRVWTVADGALCCHFRSQAGRVWSLSFSHDGRHLLTAADQGATLWELPQDQWPQRSFIAASGTVNNVACVPDTNQLIATTAAGNIAGGSIDGETSWATLPIQVLDRATANHASVLPDGTLLFPDPSGVFQKWHFDEQRAEAFPVSATPVDAIAGHPDVPFELQSWALAPDGRHLAASYTRGLLQIWSLPSLEPRFREQHAWPHPRLLVPSPDSRTLAVQGYPGELRFLDLVANRWIGEKHELVAALTCLSFSPSGDTLALGFVEGTLQIVDVPTAAVRRQFSGHPGNIHAVAFAPDGKTLVSGGADGTVRLWHVATQQPLFTLRKSDGAIRSLTFTSDGQALVATGHPDATGRNVWLWHCNQTPP